MASSAAPMSLFKSWAPFVEHISFPLKWLFPKVSLKSTSSRAVPFVPSSCSRFCLSTPTHLAKRYRPFFCQRSVYATLALGACLLYSSVYCVYPRFPFRADWAHHSINLRRFCKPSLLNALTVLTPASRPRLQCAPHLANAGHPLY